MRGHQTLQGMRLAYTQGYMRRLEQVVQSQCIPCCIYSKPLDILLGPPAATLHNCCNNRLWTGAGLTSSANIGEASSNHRTGCKSYCSLIKCTEVQIVPIHFPMTINGQRDPAFKAYAMKNRSPRTALFNPNMDLTMVIMRRAEK